jgi:hypothetical protein
MLGLVQLSKRFPVLSLSPLQPNHHPTQTGSSPLSSPAREPYPPPPAYPRRRPDQGGRPPARPRAMPHARSDPVSSLSPVSRSTSPAHAPAPTSPPLLLPHRGIYLPVHRKEFRLFRARAACWVAGPCRVILGGVGTVGAKQRSNYSFRSRDSCPFTERPSVDK